MKKKSIEEATKVYKENEQKAQREKELKKQKQAPVLKKNLKINKGLDNNTVAGVFAL